MAYDVTYSTDVAVAQWQQYRRSLSALLAEDRRDEALALFMRLAGSSEDGVEGAENSPYWPGLQALAPTTLAYDAACIGNGGSPTDRLSTITQPTLVVTRSLVDPYTGGLQPGFFDAAADAIAGTAPNAERRIVESRSHAVEPTVLGPVLEQFFTG